MSWCGAMLKQVTVFKRPWLMFACIADEIMFLHPMIEDLFPLDAGGKARAPSTTEPGFLQFVDDVVRAQLFDALLPGLVAPDLQVGLDIPGSAIKRLKNSWFSRSRHAPFLTRSAQMWSDTIRCLAGIRQGNAPIIGLNLNDLGPLPYPEMGILAI